jgi:hypothetical protein
MRAILYQTGRKELERKYRLHCPLASLSSDGNERLKAMADQILEAMFSPENLANVAQPTAKPKPNGPIAGNPEQWQGTFPGAPAPAGGAA